MQSKSFGRWAVMGALLAVACGDGGKNGGGGGGGGSANDVVIDDAEVVCDPSVSSFDDAFFLRAWTVNASSVEITIKQNGSTVVRSQLSTNDGEYWSQQLWGDDIDADCDDFGAMRFYVAAEGDNGSTDELELF